MKSNKCVILIPIYKNFVNFDEYRSIQNTISLYNDKYDVFFMCNDKLDITLYKKYFNIDFKIFSEWQNNDVFSYSDLLITKDFYKQFLNYEYMLIAHHDAYIFNNIYSLEYFMNKNYPYLGALYNIYGIEFKLYNNNLFDKFYNFNYTIKDIKNYIMKYKFLTKNFNDYTMYTTDNNMFWGMNGGLSLRKIDIVYYLLKKEPSYFWAEDNKICSLMDKYSLLDNILFKDVMNFAFEPQYYKNFYKNHNILPFAYHKFIWNGYNSFFKDKYINESFELHNELSLNTTELSINTTQH